MAGAKTNRTTWLYITENNLAVIEVGADKNSLPFMKVIASINVNNPLETSSTYVPWVKKHCSKTINLLLSHSLYQLLLSDVPDVPEAEINDAIALKAADLINYDIDEATIDVIHLPREVYRGRMRMAFIIAARKKGLSDLLKNLILKGIKVDVIDIEISQLRNLAVKHQTINESGILFLQRQESRLILNYHNEMVVSRSFDIGQSSLVVEQTVLDGELEVTDTNNSQFEIQIEALALEIRRSFDYYEAQLGLGAISEMQFLCDEHHEKVASELASRLGVRFHLLRIRDLIDIEINEENIDPANFIGLSGLVYREALQ